MAYQPKSYRKFLATSVAAAMVATVAAPLAAPSSADAAGFNDVAAGVWFEKNVNYLVDKGVTEGYADGTFRPNAGVTRAEAATFLVRALGLEVVESPTLSFSDTNDSAWYAGYVAALVDAGIVEGNPDGTFAPNATITRAALAKMVVEAYELTQDASVAVSFNDTVKGAWYEGYVNTLASLGIVQGTSATTFAPNATVTRAQAAAFLHRTEVPAERVSPSPDQLALEIVDVNALTQDGKYIEVLFNKSLNTLNKNQVIIQNKETYKRAGVESVELAADGKSATITLYGETVYSNSNDPLYVLDQATTYTLSVIAGGATLSRDFEIPAFEESRITSVDAKNRTITSENNTYDVPADTDFDFQAALGVKTKIWYTKDETLVRVEYSSAETVLYDRVEVTKVSGSTPTEFKLKNADKKYDVTSGATIELNGSSALTSVGAVAEYAKVVVDNKGKVIFVDAHDFATKPYIVDEVDGDVVYTVEGEEIDFSDYVITKDGKTITAKDLTKGDLLFINSTESNIKGEDGFAVVYNKTVSGEIESVFQDDLEISGKLYDYTADSALYLDGDKLETVDDDIAKEFQAGGDVTLYLNTNGKVVYITGSQENVISSTVAVHTVKAIEGFYLRGEDSIDLEYVDENGKAGSETIKLQDLDLITYNGNDYDIDEDERDAARLDTGADANGATSIQLGGTDGNDDGVALALNGTDNMVIEIKRDDSGKAKELIFLSKTTGTNLELDDKYAASKLLKSSTKVFNGSDGFDSLATPQYNPEDDEITTSTWGDLSGKGFTVLNYTVFYNSKNEAKYLVIERTNNKEEQILSAVITDSVKNTDGKVVKVKAFAEGKEQTFTVDKWNGSLSKGNVVSLTLNKDTRLVTGIVKDASETFTLGTTSSYVLSNSDFALTGKVVGNVNTRDNQLTLDFDGDMTTTPDRITFTLVAGGTVVDSSSSDYSVKALRDLRENYTVTLSADDTSSTISSRFIDLIKIVSK